MKFLIEGENVIKKFSRSRIVYFKFYFLAAIMFLIPILRSFFKTKIPFPDIYIIAIPLAIGFLLNMLNK
jgi:hypothetical protein